MTLIILCDKAIVVVPPSLLGGTGMERRRRVEILEGGGRRLIGMAGNKQKGGQLHPFSFCTSTISYGLCISSDLF